MGKKAKAKRRAKELRAEADALVAALSDDELLESAARLVTGALLGGTPRLQNAETGEDVTVPGLLAIRAAVGKRGLEERLGEEVGRRYGEHMTAMVQRIGLALHGPERPEA